MKTSRLIRVKEETYNSLAQCGTLTDTFDTVIQALLESRADTQAEKIRGNAKKGFDPQFNAILHRRKNRYGERSCK